MKYKFLGILLTLSSLLYGEEEPPLSGQQYNYSEEFVNMLITLVVILSLVGVSVWFLKKFTRSRLRVLGKTAGIRVLERRALHPKASLYLVDILGKGVVLAESQSGGIHLVTEFPEGVNVELLLNEREESGTSKTSFKETFQKQLKRLKKRDELSSR